MWCFANIPDKILLVDTGYVFVGLEDYKELLPPRNLFGEFGNGIVNLKWDAVLR